MSVGKRAGKTQAMLEHAAVASDQMLDAGVRNPVVVYAFVGRVSELRERLDAMGAKAVRVQEVKPRSWWCGNEETSGSCSCDRCLYMHEEPQP